MTSSSSAAALAGLGDDLPGGGNARRQLVGGSAETTEQRLGALAETRWRAW